MAKIDPDTASEMLFDAPPLRTERDPADRKTLEDAFRTAYSIHDASTGDPAMPSADDLLTLAQGFIILAQDLAGYWEAVTKGKHHCGWCEKAGIPRGDLPSLTLDEIREHTVTCEHNPLVQQVVKARTAARRLVALIDDLGAFVDDDDPRIRPLAGPMGEAQADLWMALGLDCNEEHARQLADIANRCAVCGWTLAASVNEGCVRGNCSHRPRPEILYAPERAKREADELHERALRNGMPPSGRWP